MPVWFTYVDESHDERKFCLSAILIRHNRWAEAFRMIRFHRQQLKDDLGIYLRKEIHARDLVSGRGRISPRVIGKWERSRIFFGLLQLVARLPEVLLFNICLDNKGIGDPHLTAWDRLVNRLERTMLEMERTETSTRTRLLAAVRDRGLPDNDLELLRNRLERYRSRVLIIADEGREHEITKAIRRMHVHNPVPSRYGEWSPGSRTRNIITERLVEDPVFKPSHRSYFIQLADCAAFALLKRETAPTPTVRRYGIHEMFGQTLSHVCYKRASTTDALGIVRK